MLYKCSICGYVYDEEGVDPNTGDKNLDWNELPDDWTCPKCHAPKSDFKPFKEESEDILDDTDFEDDFDIGDDFNDFNDEEENY